MRSESSKARPNHSQAQPNEPKAVQAVSTMKRLHHQRRNHSFVSPIDHRKISTVIYLSSIILIVIIQISPRVRKDDNINRDCVITLILSHFLQNHTSIWFYMVSDIRALWLYCGLAHVLSGYTILFGKESVSYFLVLACKTFLLMNRFMWSALHALEFSQISQGTHHLRLKLVSGKQMDPLCLQQLLQHPTALAIGL